MGRGRAEQMLGLYASALPSIRQERNGLISCACCGCLTVGEAGSWEICPVCFWEDDPLQDSQPDETFGANQALSLNQARENYKAFGACKECYKADVRLPTAEELP